MSMLADRKRKQKWSLNPRGNLWSQDGNKFGQKMLEKMGWSQGKGLGANLNGMTEHVRVTHKSDTAGIGFKDADGWTEHESNFSELLQNLAGNSAKTENPGDDKPTKLTSLEKTSEKSRKRVHYHKFTRGKDLSRYSEKDLASIFGKKSLKAAPKEVTVEEEKPEEKEHDYGVQTHNAGSMLDYFSKKLKNLNKKNGGSKQKVVHDVNVKGSESESEINRGFGFGFKATESPSIVKKSEDSGIANPAFDPLHGTMKMKKHALATITEDQSENDNTFNTSGMSFTSDVSPECVNEGEQAVVSSKKKRKSKNSSREATDTPLMGIDNPSLNLNCAEEDTTSNAHHVKQERKKKKKKKAGYVEGIDNPCLESAAANEESTTLSQELSVENGDNDTTKDTKKKKKNKERGIDNSAFQENKLSISGIDFLPAESFQTTQEESVEEVSKVGKKQKKKKRKEMCDGIDNPCLNLDLLNEGKENAAEVVSAQEVKRSKKKRKIEMECSAETCEETVNAEETVPVKKKKRKNASINETNVSPVSGLDNPSFNFNNSSEVEKTVSETEKDEAQKEKKRKKRKNKDDCNGIDNPCLNLDSSADCTDISKVSDDFEVKRRKKDRTSHKTASSESLNTEEVPPENDADIGCDLMLNVCAEPVPEKKQKIKTDRRSVVERRRSVRFSTTNEERIIPLDPNQPLITPSKSHDNKNFDLAANLIEENVNSMAETIDQYQAEVENDLNEAKWNEMAVNELMVGEIGDPNGENELLPSGETKLRLKHAQFGKPPSWLINKTPDSYAKKSYKHLIKGDIVLGFNHSNLHEIKGYAHHV